MHTYNKTWPFEDLVLWISFIIPECVRAPPSAPGVGADVLYRPSKGSFRGWSGDGGGITPSHPVEVRSYRRRGHQLIAPTTCFFRYPLNTRKLLFVFYVPDYLIEKQSSVGLFTFFTPSSEIKCLSLSAKIIQIT